MARPFVTGTPTKAFSSTSSDRLTLARPAGAQTGDLLVADLRTSGSTSPTDFASPGFTRQGFPFKPSDPAGRVLGQYARPITDITSEPSEYTFIKSVADGRSAGDMYLVRGADLASFSAGRSGGWTAVDPVVNTHAFTADTTEPCLLVYAFGNEVTSPSATAPTATPGTQIALTNSHGEAAPTNVTRSVLWSGFEPQDGTDVPAKFLTWASPTLAGPSASAFVIRGLSAPVETPDGFRNVTQMLARKGATWAHRGGSVNFPEMSEYGYDRSAQAGYGVLEFSAQRTSDGVWFGLHDSTLNRTSQTTGLPDVSTMTWAQVQTHMNTLNSAGTPRPYYRLIDFLDKFTPTHVVMVDPKNAIGTYDTEFLALLDAHGGPSKIVVKFFGVGSGAAALADKARAKRYQTWGYFYPADVANGDLATYQGHWSILGMEYTASQADWNAILAYGKPVAGHIVPDQAGYNMAMAKGARFAQVSAPLAVSAVSVGKFQPWDSINIGGSPIDALAIGSEQVWP